MKTPRKTGWALLALALLAGLTVELRLFAPRDAHAIIGRPLTPMSYAGVARRTTRRTMVAGAAYSPYYW